MREDVCVRGYEVVWSLMVGFGDERRKFAGF